MLKTKQSPSSPGSHFFQKTTFRDIDKLENEYRRLIRGRSFTITQAMKLIPALDKAYQKIVRYTRSVKDFTVLKSGCLNHQINVYLEQMKTIHEENMRWLLLYIDLRWPDEKYKSQKDQYRAEKLRTEVAEKAKNIWEGLERSIQDQSPRENKVLILKKMRDEWPLGSSDWRRANKRLSDEIFAVMRAGFVTGRYLAAGRFKITVYSESLIDYCRHVDSLPSDVKEVLNTSDEGELRKIIQDWRHGYLFIGQDVEAFLHGLVEGRLGRDIRTWEKLKLRRITSKISILFLGFIIFSGLFQQTDLDNYIIHNVVTSVRKVLRVDLASIQLRRKLQYFEKSILDLEVNYTPQEVLLNTRYFVDNGLDEYEDGYMFFAEHIMKGFLLLLSEWKVDYRLTNEVLTAAFLLDPKIETTLGNIVDLYNQESMRESELRAETLNLRRIFVRHDVFPFMFLALKNDTPFIFVYPEKILGTLTMGKYQVDQLGIDVSYYERLATPPRAYVVRGDKYPFKKAAGYYEGEFAVVFTSLTKRPDWTGWHELGHVTDDLRFEFEDVPLPKNVELNAMLFPMLFAKDPKNYVLQRLFWAIEKKDAYDHYVQSAKGILNGIMIYQAEKNNQPVPPLISNRFEKKRIKYAKEVVNSFSPEEITSIAHSFYHNPKRYLATTDPGRYKGAFTNVEELIFGMHGPPQRGFILEHSFGIGRSSSNRGPVLIRDGMEEGDDLSESFSFFQRLAEAIRFIFGRGERRFRTDDYTPLVAAILVFIFFEGMAVLLHFLSTPVRLKKFKGQLTGDIIDHVYDKNGWSNGKSYGQEAGARRLLKRVMQSDRSVDDRLEADVEAFKKTTNAKERALFNLGLALAPTIPQKSVITKQYHLLLFYLPFIGPYIARFPWIWPGQKGFVQREHFNSELKKLAVLADTETKLPVFLNNYQDILNKYAVGDPLELKREQMEHPHYDELERLVFDQLQEHKHRVHIAKGISSNKILTLTEGRMEFDRLEKYLPGDDIREIDWNVTARNVKGEAIVRKKIKNEAFKVAFLLDLRNLSEQEDRINWAGDFVKSIKVVGQERKLDTLIFVLPEGDVTMQNLKTADLDQQSLAKRVMAQVKEKCDQVFVRHIHEPIKGLKFYNDRENERYRQNISLGLYDSTQEEGKLKHINVKNLNIFMVGVKVDKRNEIDSLVGRRNRRFYW